MAVLAIVPVSAAAAPVANWDLGGRPVLDYAVSTLADAGSVDEIVVAATLGADPLVVLADVLSRRHPAAVVVVHDPLRPLASARIVDNLIQALLSSDAAVAAPVIPVTDTLKSADDGGFVIGTLDRARFHAVSTPLVIRGAALVAALAGLKADLPVADLAADLLTLLREHGAGVVTVPGTSESIRISDAADLAVAEAIVAARAATPTPR
jgi:2-C-methyl-D-erythritol 4-phosphate cytidylyltransferase